MQHYGGGGLLKSEILSCLEELNKRELIDVVLSFFVYYFFSFIIISSWSHSSSGIASRVELSSAF
jgi:hypothetical protein